LGAELSFKGEDLLTDRRLADTTFFRNSGKALLFGYSDEQLHRIEFVHAIPLFFYGMNCICLSRSFRVRSEKIVTATVDFY